jgi:hypothetical protein
MGGCCTSRDRNDKVLGIDTRNNMNFYYNYPALITFINSRLEEISQIKENLSSVDLNYLKWAYN